MLNGKGIFVLILLTLKNHPKFSFSKQRWFIILAFLRSKIWHSLTGLLSWCWQGCIPLHKLSQSGNCSCFWCQFFHLQNHNSRLVLFPAISRLSPLSSHLPLWLFDLSLESLSAFMDLYSEIMFTWITQENSSQSL